MCAAARRKEAVVDGNVAGTSPGERVIGDPTHLRALGCVTPAGSNPSSGATCLMTSSRSFETTGRTDRDVAKTNGSITFMLKGSLLGVGVFSTLFCSAKILRVETDGEVVKTNGFRIFMFDGPILGIVFFSTFLCSAEVLGIETNRAVVKIDGTGVSRPAKVTGGVRHICAAGCSANFDERGVPLSTLPRYSEANTGTNDEVVGMDDLGNKTSERMIGETMNFEASNLDAEYQGSNPSGGEIRPLILPSRF